MTVSGQPCISTFLENMDHEFPDYQETVPFNGYKVDGNAGIKVHCQLRQLKSVDYFYDQQSRLLFIEFSDLSRHRDSVEERKEEVSGAKPLTPHTKKQILKNIGCEIHKELRTKYTDSLSILGKVGRHTNNMPIAFECSDNEIKFHIVVPPLPNVNEGKDKVIDLIRFYDNLKDKVKAAIPAQMLSDVIIYPVSKIETFLS